MTEVTIIAYASSVDWRKNHLCSAAQFNNALSKNRGDFDVPLVAKSELDRRDDALQLIREEVMNWLPDSAEGDAFKAKLICQIDAALSKSKD